MPTAVGISSADEYQANPMMCRHAACPCYHSLHVTTTVVYLAARRLWWQQVWLVCGALPGVGVQTPPCKCWHGRVLATFTWHPPSVFACMGHASYAAYVCHHCSLTQWPCTLPCVAMGACKTSFPRAAGYSCVSACYSPVVSSLCPCPLVSECCW